MIYSDTSKKTEKYAALQQQVFKRPYGVGVQPLGKFLASKEKDSDEKEFNMKVTSLVHLQNSTNFSNCFRFSKEKKKTSTNCTSL